MLRYFWSSFLVIGLLFFSIPVLAEDSQGVEITCSSQVHPKTGKLLMSAKLTKDGKPVLVKGKWSYSDQENRQETKDQSMTMSVQDIGTKPGKLETTWSFSGTVYGEPYFSEKKCTFTRIGLETHAQIKDGSLLIDGEIVGDEQVQGKWIIRVQNASGEEIHKEEKTSNQHTVSFRFPDVKEKVTGTLSFIGRIGEQKRTLLTEFQAEPKAEPTIAKQTETKKIKDLSAKSPKQTTNEGKYPLGAVAFIICTVAVFIWMQWTRWRRT